MKEQESLYWADQIADRIINERGKKKVYTVASGITPSGRVHIGNFREEMTVNLVKRALESKGAKVRYIHSWDNYDRFRKVPTNAPKEWEKHLGLPVSKVPDPWKCHRSYGEHFESDFEGAAKLLGISPEYINETNAYNSCSYKDLIKEAMLKRDLIKVALNKFRKESLGEHWYPVEVYCESCGTDATKITSYDGEYKIGYECACGNADEVDFSKKGIVKLKWRTDWAMRWKFYDVDFEPAGKDHSVAGGSRDTSKIISETVFNYKAPVYQMYDFVTIKGQTGKMSKSAGNVFVPADLLKIYLPGIVRYFYAGTRPKAEFSIPFEDEEIFKVYEDFYFAERVYYGKEKLEDKKAAHWKRVYEMSIVDKPAKKMPVQLPFKYLVMLSQFYEDNRTVLKKLIESKHIKKTQSKELRIGYLIECARTWAKEYAPEDYVYQIQEEKVGDITQEEKDALRVFIEKINQDFTENDLYAIGKDSGLGGNFFKLCYRLLLNKERGPRLYELVDIIGKNKIEEILSKYL